MISEQQLYALVLSKHQVADRSIYKVLYLLEEYGYLEKLNDEYVFTSNFVLELLKAVDDKLAEIGESVGPKRARIIIGLQRSEEERNKFIVEEGGNRLREKLERLSGKVFGPFEISAVRAIIDVFLSVLKNNAPDKYALIHDYVLKSIEVHVPWAKKR